MAVDEIARVLFQSVEKTMGVNEPNLLKPFLVFIAILFLTCRVYGQDLVVHNSKGLRSALKTVKPGTTITLMPGQYRGGISLSGISGQKNAPITLSGRNKHKPPVFVGGNEALHLSNCSHIVIRNIRVRGYPVNGINIDDGGTYSTPSKHIVLENVTIQNTGPTGNHDALKMSGVDHFVIRNCTFRGWGGSAIDMVGCHHGVVEDCQFFGAKGFSQSTGIQMKGGTTHILVRQSFFKNAGYRAINLGGRTGLKYFRPRVDGYEAKNITVAGNRFVGSEAPLAWVTADGGHVHHNTFMFPGKWVLRILQETSNPDFKPCGNGVFENNLIVFDKRVRVFVNVGPGTDPQSFLFSRNAWHQTDGSRKPALPVAEQNGIYLANMKLKHPETKQMMITSQDPRLVDIGADAYEAQKDTQ